MNKGDFTKELGKELGLSERKADEILDKVFGTMFKALLGGDRIEVRGLGTFSVREYPGFIGRNPKTGQETVVQPKKLPFFRAGKELNERLNSGQMPMKQ